MISLVKSKHCKSILTLVRLWCDVFFCGGEAVMAKNQHFIRVENTDDEGISIEIKGSSNQFGALDLQVEAIKSLISMMDFKFAEEEDFDIRQKVYLQILDAVGSMIKLDFEGFSDEKRNIEAVRDFLNWVLEEKLHEHPGYKELLDQPKEEDDFDFSTLLEGNK